MVDDARPRLGRGLAALIGDTVTEASTIDRSRGQKKVPIEFLRPNPNNPRKYFNDESLQELTASIREKGVIQPIIARSIGAESNHFEIIAGERRWRAAQLAGLHEVPVVVVDVSERESLELAIIENVQREDLNPMDEARGYEELAERFGYSQLDIAKIIGKSRSHIANTIRLLKLPEISRQFLERGDISAGHGRALLASTDPDALAKRIIEHGLSVRDTEKLTQKVDVSNSAGSEGKIRKAKDADTRALERTLTDALGMSVSIKHRGEKGEISIRYRSLDQLDALCQKLRNS